MIEFIRSFFRKPEKKPVIPTRSKSEEGEGLTNWERYYILHTSGTCPDCETGKLLAGPSFGIMTNTLCPMCGSEFNLSPPLNGDLIGQRLPFRGLHHTLHS